MLPHKAVLIPLRDIHAKGNLKIHFFPSKMASGYSVLWKPPHLLDIIKPSCHCCLCSGESFVLLALPVSSSSKDMKVALSLRWSHVFSACLVLEVNNVVRLANCLGAEVLH